MTSCNSGKPAALAIALAPDALRIDGRGGDPLWSRATPVCWETDNDGHTTGVVTRARFAYSSRALYVLWQIESTGFNTDLTRPTDAPRARLYEEDCVELFLGPDPSEPWRYYEMEHGPFGHFWDLEIDRRAKKADDSWSSGAVIATAREPSESAATIEAMITAPGIVRALAPGARLPMGLYRMEGRDPRVYLAWSPTRTKVPNFHVPAAFGSLVLGS
jgi:hypothetical protein